MTRLELRPFRTARTYANLKAHGEGVLHVTDDVLLLARAAVGELDPPPPMVPATAVRGQVLSDACRYYEFKVVRCDDRAEPQGNDRGRSCSHRSSTRLFWLQPGQACGRRGCYSCDADGVFVGPKRLRLNMAG